MNTFLIIGTVSNANTLKELLKNPSELECCDVVELRLDEHMDKDQCLQLCRDLRQYTKVLLTIRTSKEGGTWNIDDQSRYELFQFFINDVDMIDLELNSKLFEKHSRDDFPESIKVIASYHDYENTPDRTTVQKFIDHGKRWGAEIVKLAVTAHDQQDIEFLESFLAQEDLCLISMGEIGAVTRCEFPLKGSALTYGYIDKCAAPGQLSAKELKKRLR